MWRTDSLEKTVMLGKIEAGGEGDDGGWNGWMASSTWWTWVWASSGSWWWTREAWRAAVHRVTKSWICLSDWSELNWCEEVCIRSQEKGVWEASSGIWKVTTIFLEEICGRMSSINTDMKGYLCRIGSSLLQNSFFSSWVTFTNHKDNA